MRYLVLSLYGFGLGLLVHGWISDSLPLSQKVGFSIVAVVILGIGVLIQWKWMTEKE